jgi:cysteine desulfurase family protein
MEFSMINFDNAATTFPKPESVYAAAADALRFYGGNPGRSGHKLSADTAEKIYETREAAAFMFGAIPENTVFTGNCTYALNLAISGLLPARSHIIISDLEHNAVARPVFALSGKRNMSVFHIAENDEKTIKNLAQKITPQTKAVVMTLGSNITGQITPFRAVGKFCAKHKIPFIADGAQAAGLLPINLKCDNINILCLPGHKGLYGPAGTGLLITDGKYKIRPIIRGGTGSSSLLLTQPKAMPDALESGTVNTSGIIALGAGINYVNKMTPEKIRRHETALCDRFIAGLKDNPKVTIYRKKNAEYLPIVLFNIEGQKSSEAAEALSGAGFCLRGGLHCAGIAHKSNGTAETDGGIRFSPGAFNTLSEVDELVWAINRF